MDFDITPQHDVLGDSAGDGYDGNDGGGYAPYTVPPEAEFGVDQVQAYDWDGDGINDSLVGYLDGVGSFDATDFDQDGTMDYLAIDTDGDGSYDVLITANYETGGYDIQWDSDGDGQLDATQTVTAHDIQEASPDLWNLINEHYAPLELGGDPGHHTGDPGMDPQVDTWYPEVSDGQVVGDPFQYSGEWFEQSFNGSCVPASVAQIYNLYTGENVSDLDFVQLANQVAGADGGQGWIVGPDGSPGLPPDAAADLLEAAGIPATATFGSMDALDQALAQGDGVMVAFDSGEVWYGEDVEDRTADHMAVVAAIDYDAGVVYLSDTGSPDGNMEAVPISVFQDAWADSDYLMVECNQSVEDFQDANGIVPTDTGYGAGDHTGAQSDGTHTDGTTSDTTQSDSTLSDLQSTLLGAGDQVHHGAGQNVEDTIVQATSHPWALLPISGTTLAQAATASRA